MQKQNSNLTPEKTISDYPVIVLMTVNDNETHALLDTFIGEGKVPTQVPNAGITYNDLGIHGSHRIIHTICRMGAGGIGSSQQRTREAIEHWHPKAVIAVGIAFGLDETKQEIGEVLVSTQIQDYELGRIGKNGKLTPRGDKPSSSDILCNRLQQTNNREHRCSNDWPKVSFGLILSGQKLVDNLDYRERLKTLFPEAIGGEMEGVGVYVGSSVLKIDWIVVKGICDWGHNKNHAKKDTWQKLAAKNAARVLKTALDVGKLYSEASALPSTNQQIALNLNSHLNKSKSSQDVLNRWIERLEFLQSEEVTAVGAAEKFNIKKEIEIAKAKIQEYRD